MNNISGKILRDHDRSGVSDVIVVLYDLDIADKGLLTKDGKNITTAPYLYLIYGISENEEDGILAPVSVGGDRLGSVITDRQGYFSLEYDDDAFRVNDKGELRPDLVLLVIAPDRSQSDNSNSAISIGSPEYQRILHISAWPNRNIARHEQVIIHLSEKALTQHDLGTKDNRTNAEDFGTAISQSAKEKQAIHNAMLKSIDFPYIVKKHKDFSLKAKNISSKISAISKTQRESSLFVASRTELQQKEKVARETGIQELSAHTDKKNIAMPFARLTLSDEDLSNLEFGGPSSPMNLDGLRDSLLNDNQIKRLVNREKFCASVQAKNGGTVLEAAKDRIAGSLPKQTSDTVSNDPEPAEPINESLDETPEMLIKRLVLDQVRSLEVNSPELSASPEEDQAGRILKTIQTLKPPASPADVTAFHDFTHLQIAFPSVWEEAFDRDLSKLLEDLHIQYQERQQETGDGKDDPRLDPDIEHDLDEFISIMQSLGSEMLATEEAIPIPPDMERFYSYSDEENSGENTSTQAKDQLHEAWPKLSAEQRAELLEIAVNAKPPLEKKTSGLLGLFGGTPSKPSHLLYKEIVANPFREHIEHVIELYRELKREEALADDNIDSNFQADLLRAKQIVANPKGRASRVQNLLTELAERMAQPHSFQVFAKDSVNFGILSVYRQEWVPGDYQVGALVSTMPLAPGETRKYTKKEMHKKTRNVKENDKNASTVKDERQITSRAVSDITEKAAAKTNFQLSHQASVSGTIIGLYNVSANTTTQFQRDQSTESQRVKKDFREAVRKASQEYKNERSIELSTEESSEFEATFSGEINNPNNEIAVTYLFYELERQYRVTEHLHRLNPVVMVAQEVPDPADIDNDWILAHEWILRRVLLDDGFHDALDYITEGLVADEIVLTTRREAYRLQKKLLTEVTDNVEMLASSQSTLRDALLQTTERQQLAEAEHKDRTRGQRRRAKRKGRGVKRAVSASIADGTSSLTLGSDINDPATLEARREALEARLAFLDENLEDSRARLNSVTVAYEKASEELITATEESFTKRNLVSQLRIHIKDNILYYMQMIWSYEPSDQRYFRLYDIKVPIFEPDTIDSGHFNVVFQSLSDQQKAAYLIGAAFGLLKPGDEVFGVQIPPPNAEQAGTRRLHQIADLDNPLGFKGNYMLFPLKECTYLTDYMMQDYVDSYFGLRDPDYASQFTTEELLRRAEEINNDSDVSLEEKEAVKDIVQARLTSPRLNDELVVVPTGQLFIEALKGEHALLEDFKIKHRGLDVIKVNEEVREMQLENLRRAARLVAEDQNLDDPDIDKSVVVQGPSSTNIEA